MSITELLEKLEKIYDFDEENLFKDDEPDNDKKTSYLN